MPAAPVAITAALPSVPGVPPDYYGYDRDMLTIPCDYGSPCLAVNDPARRLTVNWSPVWSLRNC